MNFFESDTWLSIQAWLMTTGLNILVALVILAAGFILAHIAAKVITRALSKTHLDASLIAFLATAARILIIVLTLITALGKLGIPTTSIITAFASCAVAIGLAMQSSLGNIAGGMFLLITRPLSTGDTVEVDGEVGTVKKIDIVSTVLVTPDNRQVIVPNGQLVNKTIKNFSREELRRLDLTASVAYSADILEAKRVISETVRRNPLVLPEPEPTVAVTEHGASAIIFAVRPWCKASDYWTLRFQLEEQLKLDLDAAGIEIPYNKLDVYVKETPR